MIFSQHIYMEIIIYFAFTKYPYDASRKLSDRQYSQAVLQTAMKFSESLNTPQ